MLTFHCVNRSSAPVVFGLQSRIAACHATVALRAEPPVKVIAANAPIVRVGAIC